MTYQPYIVKRQDAGVKYAHYECDYCKQPIGYYGAMKLRQSDAGVWVPWACVCTNCIAEGRRA